MNPPSLPPTYTSAKNTLAITVLLADTRQALTTVQIAERLEIHPKSVERCLRVIREVFGAEMVVERERQTMLGHEGFLPALFLLRHPAAKKIAQTFFASDQ